METVWNEKYLEAGKIAEPCYAKQLKQGLSHVTYGIKSQKIAVFFLIVYLVFDNFVKKESDSTVSFATSVIAGMLTINLIGYPIILSLWADLTGAKIKNENRLRWIMPTKMLVVTILYTVIASFLSCFLLLPGLWFMATFCLTLPVLCIEEKGILESFSRSAEIVKGNYFRVLTYLIFWPVSFWLVIGFSTIISVYLLDALKAPEEISNFIFAFSQLIGNLFDLFFLIPIVYMYAYLVDKRD